MRRDVPTAPEAMLGPPAVIFDRSTSQFVRPMRPSGPRRSRSALNVRVSSRDFTTTQHSIENRLLEVPGAWHASGPYLYWPCAPKDFNPRRLTNHLSSHTISTPRWASVTRPRPDSDTPHLVSLVDIAARFGLACDCIHTLNACSYAPTTLRFIVLNEADGRIRDPHLVVYAKTNLHLLPGYEYPYPVQAQEGFEHEHNDVSDMYSDSDLIDLRSRAGSAASLRAELSSPSSVASTPASSVQWDNVQPSPSDEMGSAGLSPIALFSRVRSGQQGRTFEFLGWYELEETEFFAPRTFELFRMLGGRYDWRSTPSAASM
ncbi:hypothetical protein M436DRAFT_60038 [Aureobasidium namibiae CBS 147.97]|uniref:Uncharacterized protein n=1 Tax=Aureobasidium namibiae CBS 147.97 TaxID=1043004 RepID=A0A074X2Z5_9PEZI